MNTNMAWLTSLHPCPWDESSLGIRRVNYELESRLIIVISTTSKDVIHQNSFIGKVKNYFFVGYLHLMHYGFILDL